MDLRAEDIGGDLSSVGQLRLIHGGQMLANAKCIADYPYLTKGDATTVHVMVSDLAVVEANEAAAGGGGGGGRSGRLNTNQPGAQPRGQAAGGGPVCCVIS